MARKGYNVAVVGATGAVGTEMIGVLESREFPVERLIPVASERSYGQSVLFRSNFVLLHELSERTFEGVDMALFSAGGEVSRQWAPVAARSGALVVDNTSAFRMDDDVPLVVPEINPQALELAFRSGRRLVANPNGSTIQMVMALHPLGLLAPIRRVVVSTYQAVSGAGRQAIAELDNQTHALLQHHPVEHHVFPARIAANLIPQIGPTDQSGFTDEEIMIMKETPKILNHPTLRVCACTVRVPVVVGHSEAVFVEFASPVTPEAAAEALREYPGVEVADDPFGYATPLDCAGQDSVMVGRIRKDPSCDHGLCLWVVTDNLRKGAALNAVQIAEALADRGMV